MALSDASNSYASPTNYPTASPTYWTSPINCTYKRPLSRIIRYLAIKPNDYIKWVRYLIILTIIWLSRVLWTSSDHQSDPIVTKAFQNPDGNCPSIYTQSKHYLSTIGSKLHHRKTIWPIMDPMKFLELILSKILTQFYHRFTQFPPCGKPTQISMCSNSTILFLERFSIFIMITWGDLKFLIALLGQTSKIRFWDKLLV